jgi:D-alanyl-D-alanine carboxypeptidase
MYEKNSQEKLYPASTTKLMTALLAAEYIESGQGKTDDIITFSHDAVYGIDEGSSSIAISVGEQLSVLQVLYAMMLPSANEACLGMAEYVSGSIDGLVGKMNERAEQLGMTGTHFVTANGLHDNDHYTTARDLAILMNEVIKHDLLLEVMSSASYEIPPTNRTSEKRTLVNTNKLILQSSEYYDSNVVCGKTGYTTPAGNVLVTYSKTNGMGIITVLMKAGQGTIFTETSALVSYCSNNFTLFRADNVLDYAKAIPTEDGDAQVMASPADGFYILTRNGDDIDSYTRTYDLPEKISAPVYENDKLGTLTFYNGEAAVGKVDMVSLSSYGTGSETGSTEATSTISGLMMVQLLWKTCLSKRRVWVWERAG